ncbi:hypothetical protein HDK77DRAFT_190168 [Phyllosticta capitalensis]
MVARDSAIQRTLAKTFRTSSTSQNRYISCIDSPIQSTHAIPCQFFDSVPERRKPKMADNLPIVDGLNVTSACHCPAADPSVTGRLSRDEFTSNFSFEIAPLPYCTFKDGEDERQKRQKRTRQKVPRRPSIIPIFVASARTLRRRTWARGSRLRSLTPAQAALSTHAVRNWGPISRPIDGAQLQAIACFLVPLSPLLSTFGIIGREGPARDTRVPATHPFFAPLSPASPDATVPYRTTCGPCST